MAWVYILESLDDGRFYIGSTTNLQKRLHHHQIGATPTTRRFGRIKLVFSQAYSSLRQAHLIELKLKKLKRKDYLKKIIFDGKIKIS